MTKIFISYRREDSADVTGRIGDRLREHFDEESVFTDVDNIPLGVDFRTHIDDEVKQCDVLLAVIGKDWLSAKNADGELRLNDPADFVRIEIESALRRDIPVIPLLVRGASIPQIDQLPDSIEELAFRNAQKIRPDPDFRNDADRLVSSLVRHFEPEAPGPVRAAPHTPEQPEISRSSKSQRQSRKPLWLGVFASSVVAAYLWVMSGQDERVGPDPQRKNSTPELGRSVPTPALPAKDFITPDMVEIPAGTFMMGSDNGASHEQPVHQVAVPAFEIARNELTWAEWKLCEDAGGCNKMQELQTSMNREELLRPVENVEFTSIMEYVNWISGRTGHSYRLPSEAEWEYATRAGTTTKYYWGDDIGENRTNCRGCGRPSYRPVPVGSFGANPFGLKDVHGNVWEWVADCWHENYQGAPVDGTAWFENCASAEKRVLRGGSFRDEPDNLRAAKRTWNFVGNADYDVGFRLAKTLP